MSEAKKPSGFMGWYESYSGKKIVNMVYCLGASVVIIGALFKILHWPGASVVLMIGMFTEAFLFAIGCLDKPHADFHWESVFPQLLGYGADPAYLEELAKRPKPTLLGGGSTGGSSTSGNGGAAVPALSDKEMEALKSGINDLAKTATQLSELSKVATATGQLAFQMNAAGEAAGKFVASANALNEKSETLGAAYQTVAADMQGVIEGTKTYQRNVEDLGGKLTSLNTVYATQLSALEQQNNQVKANGEQINAMAASVQKMNESAAEAMKSHAAFEEGSKKLASQVADLNKIYGNMLTALA